MASGSQIRGGLWNLENRILTLTPSNQLMRKGLSPVKNLVIETHSHLRGCFLAPREFGVWKLLSVRLSKAGGLQSITPRAIMFAVKGNRVIF